MTFSRKKKYRSKNCKLGGTEIEEVSIFKYLGIHIDKNLSFKTHIEKVLKRLAIFSSIFYRLRKVLKPHQLVRAFKTYIQPIVQDRMIVCTIMGADYWYGCTTKSLLRQISSYENFFK